MKSFRAWASVACMLALATTGYGQAECNGWGEFRGIRLEGELMPFSTSVKLVGRNGMVQAFSATQTIANPRFSRNGDTQTSSASIGGNALAFTQTVQDMPGGAAKVTVETMGNRAQGLMGTYYYVTVPADLYAGGKVTVLTDGPDEEMPGTLNPGLAGAKHVIAKAKGVRLVGPQRTVEIRCESPVEFTVQSDKLVDTDYFMIDGLRLPVDEKSLARFSISFPIVMGDLAQGQKGNVAFTIKAGGTVDRKPVALSLDWAHPGPGFDGIGGNFRIQNPTLDPIHLNYNLQNLRVAWGRVEMPLAAWWPQENVDPVAAATNPALLNTPAPGDGGGRGGRRGPAGPANMAVQRAMEMARTLADKKIPFVISTWDMPGWAYGPAQRKPDQPAGIQALRMNPDKLDTVCAAMVSYLVYLKNNFRAEAALVSFNESDLGINVLFTPQQHADFIRRMGPMLEAAGLKTKLLLGDACSPHPVHFIDAAMKDPECVKYIGGVSFHSWHDGTPEEFAYWGAAAQKLKVPLLCGEGGTDSDAYRYPQIFLEPWFGRYELDTYLNMLRYGQAQSILHWQLTENYSVLTAGGGGTPVVPTRRFFNLKQLDLTPVNTPFVPLTGGSASMTPVAYGDADKGVLAVHLLNNGPAREVMVMGLPAGVKEMRVFVTDQTRQMKELEKVAASAGSVRVLVDADAYVTLIAGQ